MNAEDVGITEKLKRNVYGSTIYKGIDVVFNFLLVRYAIQFFGAEDYGVWLTILSFFAWFSVIEFGISSSFRNQLTQYFADKKFDAIRTWVGMGYRATTIIYLIVIALFLIIYNSIGYSFDQFDANFNLVFQISFVLYMVHYMLFFLQTVLLATHHAQTIYIISAVQKAVLLFGIIAFIEFELTPSMSFICLWFSAIPIIIWTIASFFSYRSFLTPIKPRIADIKSSKTRPFSHVQKAFFIIQISTLIIYATDNIIIINGMTGADVTYYNIAFKYFNILIILFNIVLLPYWSSFTEAAHRKDISWIKKNVRRLIMLWLAITGLSVIMLVASSYAYELWIGKPVTIPLELSIFMGISVLITCWNNIFSYFLNSISKTKRQMLVLVISALINVPLSFYLLDQIGITGVIIATSIVLLPLSIVLPLQYRSVIKKLEA
ncbi:MAG: O-antigen/teichoic acid export membrane protein [Crocinitomix sp.]|jgi:O-antigen/teichoic acid export membrane protein